MLSPDQIPASRVVPAAQARHAGAPGAAVAGHAADGGGFIDRRPEAAVQARLQRLANAAGALPGRRVVQRTGDDTVEGLYKPHKPKVPMSSKWDSSSSDTKKDKVWEVMEKDAYANGTSGFLGVKGTQAIPTTHHMFSKSTLPQYEFEPAILRLGPNVALRSDDPGQLPDYNRDHGGDVTPRSQKIGKAFESGDPQLLKSTIDEISKTQPKQTGDYDQWYINKANWDRIAPTEKADKKAWDDFWATPGNVVMYYETDYSKKLSDHNKGTPVPGIPWSKTALLSEALRIKFAGVNFLSRGGQVLDANQILITSTFRTLKENNLNYYLTLFNLHDLSTQALAQASATPDRLNALIKGTEKKFLDVANKMVAAIAALNANQSDVEAILNEQETSFKDQITAALHLEWEKYDGAKKAHDAGQHHAALHKRIMDTVSDEEQTALAQLSPTVPPPTKDQLAQTVLKKLQQLLTDELTRQAAPKLPPLAFQVNYFDASINTITEQATLAMKNIREKIEEQKTKLRQTTFKISDITSELATHGITKYLTVKPGRDLKKNDIKNYDVLVKKIDVWTNSNSNWVDDSFTSSDAKKPKEVNKNLHKFLNNVKKLNG